MTAFMKLLPAKSSRTSTHAVIVPSTALSADTITAAPSVSLSAATDSGAETTDQNSCQPCFPDVQTSAATGRRTTTERNVVTNPNCSGAPGRGRRCNAGNEIALLASARSSDRLLDLDHSALVRVEPHLVGVPPAADVPVVDLEDARARRELLGVLRQDLLVHRAEPVLAEQVL